MQKELFCAVSESQDPEKDHQEATLPNAKSKVSFVKYWLAQVLCLTVSDTVDGGRRTQDL